MAAEVLKKKIQELMNERDEALEAGDKLEKELGEMKEQLLKVGAGVGRGRMHTAQWEAPSPSVADVICERSLTVYRVSNF